mmetsp:Transcript_7081/g.20490  ORF Transcript_7081/g.20490 Transcript_7081/m.20490 type:complete len:277 (+) Transcript_7081:1366-2196(+)
MTAPWRTQLPGWTSSGAANSARSSMVLRLKRPSSARVARQRRARETTSSSTSTMSSPSKMGMMKFSVTTGPRKAPRAGMWAQKEYRSSQSRSLIMVMRRGRILCSVPEVPKKTQRRGMSRRRARLTRLDLVRTVPPRAAAPGWGSMLSMRSWIHLETTAWRWRSFSTKGSAVGDPATVVLVGDPMPLVLLEPSTGAVESSRNRRLVSARGAKDSAKLIRTTSSGSTGSLWRAGKMYLGKISASDEGTWDTMASTWTSTRIEAARTAAIWSSRRVMM